MVYGRWCPLKRRPLYMIELEQRPALPPEQQNTPLDHNQEFIENFQTAILLSLLEKGQLAKKLREQYIKEPPEGVISDEVREMSDEDLLDMDYFLHEFDDIDDDDFGEEGFYLF